MADAEFRTYDQTKRVEMFPGVVRHTLAVGDRITLVRIDLDEGAVVPEHSHMHEQSGTLISGCMLLRIGTEERELGEGASYLIPGDAPHYVKALAPCVLVEVFSPAREDFKAADA